MLQDPFGVAVGGTLGHCLCTGLAVIGGRMVAQKISVRTGETESFSTVHHVLTFFISTDLYPDLFADTFCCYLYSYNRWWNRFPCLCVLRSLYQARFWILMEELTLGFNLYTYNPEQVEQRETSQRLQMACLYVWMKLFCVSKVWLNEWMKNYLLLMLFA